MGKMEESKFNRWYKEVKSEKIPRYLKKRKRERRWERVARFSLGVIGRTRREEFIGCVKEEYRLRNMFGKSVGCGGRRKLAKSCEMDARGKKGRKG